MFLLNERDSCKSIFSILLVPFRKVIFAKKMTFLFLNPAFEKIPSHNSESHCADWIHDDQLSAQGAPKPSKVGRMPKISIQSRCDKLVIFPSFNLNLKRKIFGALDHSDYADRIKRDDQ